MKLEVQVDYPAFLDIKVLAEIDECTPEEFISRAAVSATVKRSREIEDRLEAKGLLTRGTINIGNGRVQP